MRLLEWIDEERRDSEAIGDAPILEGLIGDGHRVVRLVAGGADVDPSASTIPESAALRRLAWSSPSRWSESAAIREVCLAIEGRGLDAVWARGRDIWSPAIAIAARCSVPIWLEIGSAEEAAAARTLRGLADFVVTVPCPSFATLLPARVRGHLLSVERRDAGSDSGRVPLAVPPPLLFASHATGAREHAGSDDSTSPQARAVILLAGTAPRRPPQVLDRVLASLARIATDATLPFELFLEERADELAPMPRRLASLGLADRVTRLPPLSQCRGVLGGEAILVSPAPLGRLEPSLIEAMARGSRFVGVSGPALRGWFVDGRDGRLLAARSDRSQWEASLRDAISAPTAGQTPAGVHRWLARGARLEAVRSVLRRLEGPLQGRFSASAVATGA